ncbi:MAG TPA: thiamine pyrophosphate-dependent enzyme [Candidatus Binatia bacterium]|nr:thiamine pyrophosphate-dependent enzyme [Candidatus Binatia bacterium]
MGKTAADQIAEMMTDAGIQRVYGVVGDSINPIVDAIRRTDGRLRWIHCRNEEVAAFAAGSDALLTGQIAACAGSCGPGNLHLIQGLYNSHRNRAPVFAIAGQVPTRFLGTEYFQETHPERIFRDCSHYCEAAYTAVQAATMSRLAIQSAITKRGVGMVCIPGDTLAQSAAVDLPSHPFFTTAPRIRPTDDDLDQLAEIINSARRPLIFGGEGCRGARDQVLEFSQKLNAPIGFSYRGKDVLEADNPNAVGMTGLLGWGGLQKGFDRCDVLIMLGTDFPYVDFIPKQPKIVQIDSDPTHLGRRVPLELGLCGHVAETLDALLPRIKPRGGNRAFLDEVLIAHRDAMKHMQTYVEHGGTDGKLRPEHVGDAVSRLCSPDSIIIADTGMCVVWAAQFLRLRPGQRVMTSFNHGTMANAMPDAIGAQMAFPDRQVIAFCGDGGLSMLMGDLLTIASHKLPIKIIVFDNSTLGMVRLEMMVGGYPFWGTEMQNPDFSAVARAIGFHSERVERKEDVAPAIERAFAHPGPALLDVTTDPNALSAPPKATFEEARGFALAMTRMVMDNRADQVFELVKDNIREMV